MPKKRTFSITIGITNGSAPPETFTVSEGKAIKIVELIQPEMRKKRMSLNKSSITLDQFFKEETK